MPTFREPEAYGDPPAHLAVASPAAGSVNSVPSTVCLLAIAASLAVLGGVIHTDGGSGSSRAHLEAANRHEALKKSVHSKTDEMTHSRNEASLVRTDFHT